MLAAYVAECNGENLCVVNIESVPAMENLDADPPCPRPRRRAGRPAIPPVMQPRPAQEYGHPRFEAAVGARSSRACGAAGVAAGVHMVYGDMAQEAAWARHGANFMLHSGDAFLVEQQLRREVNQLRRELGDATGNVDDRMTAI